MRYFFDHFTNDPTYTEGNLLSYRNPDAAVAGASAEHRRVVDTDDVEHVAQRVRVGYNRMHARRFPPTNNVPSMQELGVRLPIYPSQPSISEINASGYFNIGDNLEASFVREWHRAERPVHHRARGSHNIQAGGEAQNYTVEIDNQFRRRWTLHLRRQPAPATRLPTSCSAMSRPSIRAPASTRTTTSGTGRRSSRTTWKVAPRFTVNLGLRYENTPPWHEIAAASSIFRSTDYNDNVRSTVFPQAPRGETFRGDPGVP